MSRASELGKRLGRAQKAAIRASEQEGFIGKWRDDDSVSVLGDDDHNDRLPTGQVYLTRYSEQLKGMETIAAYCLTVTPQARAGVWYRVTSKRTAEVLRLSGKTASELLGQRVFDFGSPPKSGTRGTNLTAGRDFMVGRLQVVVGGTLKLNVSEAFWYFDTDGVLKRWEPTVDNALDAAANVPAQDDGIDQRQLTVVTFSKDATTPGLAAHDVATRVVTQPALTAADIVGNFTLPDNHILIGALHQRTNDTTVTNESQFIDMRLWIDGTAKSSEGTVTSVGLTMPSEFSVASSPVTGSGTLAVTKAVQVANRVYAGPASGADAAPTFRALVKADVPLASINASDLASHYEPVTNGSLSSPELVFSGGDVVMVEVA